MKLVFGLGALTDHGTSDRGDAGALRIEADKIYRLFKNKEGVTLDIGDVIFHGSNDLLGIEAYQFGQSAKGTAATLMAGVAMSAALDGEYFWGQIFGYNASINTIGHASNVVGASLKGVSGQDYVNFDTAVATAPTCARHIISLEAYVTVTPALKPGIIRCM